MKIYLVKKSHGEYDSYFSYSSKAFIKQDNVQAYVDEYNSKLKEKCSQYDGCENCFYNRDYSLDDEYIKIETQEEAHVNALRICKLADITVNNDDEAFWYTCKNRMSYCDSYDQHSARTKELEIEDWNEFIKSKSN